MATDNPKDRFIAAMLAACGVLLLLIALLTSCSPKDDSVHCPVGNWCDEHGAIVPAAPGLTINGPAGNQPKEPLPSRPLSEVDVQGHLPPCPAGREIHYCGIFGPDNVAQCWVEGCDRE